MNKQEECELDKIKQIIQSYLVNALNNVFSERDTYESYKERYNGKVLSKYKTYFEEIKVVIENDDYVMILFDGKKFSPESFKAMENSLKVLSLKIEEKQ